jgi:hypothetical protein
VIDRNNDEAGVGERLCEIVISEERPAAPVRHDDEWQIFAADGTVLRGRQFERPDRHDAGGRLARRPDAAPYLCPVAARRDIKKLKPGCLRAAAARISAAAKIAPASRLGLMRRLLDCGLGLTMGANVGVSTRVQRTLSNVCSGANWLVLYAIGERPVFAHLRHGVMSRVDVERTYGTAALDASVGRIAPLPRPPRERPRFAPTRRKCAD